MLHAPHRPHARTVALVQLLRSVGGVRCRGGRLPRQQQPDAIRREYASALLPVVDLCRRRVAEVRVELLRELEQARASQALTRRDAGEDARAQAIIAEIARKVGRALDLDELHQVAARFGKRTTDFQRAQLDRQVRQAIGVPYAAIERPIRDLVPEFAARNVDLIRTVPERYFGRLEASVRQAFEEGESAEVLSARIEEVGGIAEDDAARIARDQVGKLNGEVNQERQESLGVTGYAWRTMNDARVRDEHQPREGVHFEWDDPPEDGHPGEPIQCRCYAEPDFGPVLDALEG